DAGATNPTSDAAILRDDLIASTYFLLAGHEEKVRPAWDAHGRFDASRSFLAQADLLGKPLVEDYAQRIREAFQSRGLTIPPPRPWPDGKPFVLLLTSDVDIPRRNTWTAVLKRCLGRNPGFPVRPADLSWPLAYVPRGEAFDPYVRNLERLTGMRESGPPFTTLFFLAGKRSRLDPVVLKPRRWLARRAQRLFIERREIALHAPYECWLEAEDFRNALDCFERATGMRPDGVRQHYLRYQVPRTWRAQAEADLQWDASAGFAAREGFRFGTALPFQAFDGERGRRLPLWIVPLAAMDSTLNLHLDLTPHEAAERLRALGAEARRVGGAMVLLVHNSSTGAGWQGWPEVFDAVATDLAEEGAWLPTVSQFLDAWRRFADPRDANP
ncbi:MAG: hypothetical protein NTW86_30925, partial [Candidatus Sumerlaeota bacterium]|nr:hypothetical protein [Candidatus Sumerlaeota bacterium]